MASDKVQLNAGGKRQLKPDGTLVLGDTGIPCCCSPPSPICFTLFGTSWNCDTSAWRAWSKIANYCLAAGTSTAITSPTPCGRRQYVKISPDETCTGNSDCTTDATAPAAPSGTPTGCCPKECGCSHALPATATVVVMGSSGLACTAAGDNTGSVQLSGNIDGIYDNLARVGGGACAWVKVFANPNLCRDCFSHTCANCGGGLDSPLPNISVRLANSGGPNSWRITVTSSGSSTLYYDSGNFAWNDQDVCDGIGSAAQANILATVYTTGCSPISLGLGGTASASTP